MEKERNKAPENLIDSQLESKITKEENKNEGINIKRENAMPLIS